MSEIRRAWIRMYPRAVFCVDLYWVLVRVILGLGLPSLGILAVAHNPGPSSIVFAIIVCALGAAIGLRSTPWLAPMPKINATLLLVAGRCPQCAYVLEDLKSEPDGCIVCPECGAAWKAEAIGKSPRRE